MYCEDCGKKIDKSNWVELKYDDAMAAEDGYGSYWSIYICRECADDVMPSTEGTRNTTNESG